MTIPNLAAKYMPRSYEDVVGQVTATSYLQALTKGGKRDRRNVLLHGSVGSGKTSLARIYGQALNCKNADDSTGSPCGQCASCRLPRCAELPNGLPCNECELCLSRRFFELDTPNVGSSRSGVRALVERAARIGTPESPVVIFIDEAHTLSASVSVDLLLAVEVQAQLPASSVVFVCATTSPGGLSAALRSRLKLLHVSPLERGEAIELLRRVTSREGLTVEIGCLELVAKYAGGQPRDLISALEVVITDEDSAIYLSDVKEAFGFDQVDHLPAYFLALADGDRTRQFQQIAAWRQPYAIRVKWIKAYLTSYYVKVLLAEDFDVEPVIDSLTSHQDAIAAAFMKRLGLRSLHELRPIWKEMLWFWSSDRRDQAEEALALELIKFHDLCNDGLIADRRKAVDAVATSMPAPQVPPPTASADVALTGFITASHIREIVNAASFLVLDQGRYFNLLFEVRPRNKTHTEAAAFVDLLVDELKGRAQAWGGDITAALPSIRLIENTIDGPIGYVLASLDTDGPADEPTSLQRAKAWLDTFPDVATSPMTSLAPHKQHWAFVKVIIMGDSPDPEVAALRERLEIRGPARRSTRLHVAPLRIRGGISEREALLSQPQPQFPLSEGRYDRVFSDWERDAHYQRSKARRTASEGPQTLVVTDASADAKVK